MNIGLAEAMRATLDGWQADLPTTWRPLLADVELGFGDIPPELELEPWEPIFPPRRGRTFPGAPAGAHILRAFEGIAPEDVRCVVVGQDPYPEPGFASGRAFEAGNVVAWRELDKMFSKSVRAFTQLIVAARTGDDRYAATFDAWPATLAAIESGKVDLEPPDEIADRWVREGVLLLNSSLTLTRFRVEVDPHQSAGHVPLWRPLILAVLRHLAARGRPTAFLAFGDVAADNLDRAGLSPAPRPHLAVVRAHPAFADQVLGRANPFVLCNDHLEAAGGRPVAW